MSNRRCCRAACPRYAIGGSDLCRKHGGTTLRERVARLRQGLTHKIGTHEFTVDRNADGSLKLFPNAGEEDVFAVMARGARAGEPYVMSMRLTKDVIDDSDFPLNSYVEDKFRAMAQTLLTEDERLRQRVARMRKKQKEASDGD